MRQDWSDLTSDCLHEKIIKLLEDPSFSNNMKIASELFQDQKEPPLDRAIWWIEWILRHPHQLHFNNLGRDLNIFQLQSLDVLAVLFFIVFLVFLILIVTVIYCLKRLCKRNKTKLNDHCDKKTK